MLGAGVFVVRIAGASDAGSAGVIKLMCEARKCPYTRIIAVRADAHCYRIRHACLSEEFLEKYCTALCSREYPHHCRKTHGRLQREKTVELSRNLYEFG